MKGSKLCMVLLLSVILSACGSMRGAYNKVAEPEEGVQKARLRVVSNYKIRGVPNKDCIDYSAPGVGMVTSTFLGSDGYKERSIGIPGADRHEASKISELYVAANQPFTLIFDVGGRATPKRCHISASFTPEENKDYEVEADTDFDKNICYMRVYELGEDRKPVALERASFCTLNIFSIFDL